MINPIKKVKNATRATLFFAVTIISTERIEGI